MNVFHDSAGHRTMQIYEGLIKWSLRLRNESNSILLLKTSTKQQVYTIF